MRILIVEEALRLGNGHWPRYVADLAAGFRAEGDEVDVLGHREANDKVKSVVPDVVPWLSRDCRSDARSQGLIGGIRHNFCLKRELGAWLKGREPYDWILSLSSRPKHLLTFAILSRARYYARSRFLLLFVISPGQQDEVGKFRLSASNLFAKFCFVLLRPAVCRGQVVIAAETEGMRVEIEKFSGLRPVLFPHPVEASQTPKIEGTTKNTNIHERGEEVSTIIERQGGREKEQPKVGPKGEGVGTTESNGTEALVAGRSALDSPAKPVLVVAPGLARYEKGSDIFQVAIKLILSNEVASDEWRVTSAKNQSAAGLSEPVTNDSLPATAALPTPAPRAPLFIAALGRSVKFVMQWPEDFDLPDGRRCTPDSDLLKDERVEFSRDLLTGDAYWDFLRRADLIVLPYRAKSYRARVSRVAIEAAMFGKPLVYTNGTWTREVADLVGAGVAVEEESAEALAAAISKALLEISSLQEAASMGGGRVRDFYTVRKFRANLLEGA